MIEEGNSRNLFLATHNHFKFFFLSISSGNSEIPVLKINNYSRDVIDNKNYGTLPFVYENML